FDLDEYQSFLFAKKDSPFRIPETGILAGLSAARQREILDQLQGDCMWMVEISIPDLFQTNTNRLGEVILAEIPRPPCGHDEECEGEEDEGGGREVRLVRLPGTVSIPGQGKHRMAHYATDADYYYPATTHSPDDIAKFFAGRWDMTPLDGELPRKD
ncbi:MAG: hypothetical protein GY851_36365, partial [bacterium]|nr:hypothetical protein [bacterium]